MPATARPRLLLIALVASLAAVSGCTSTGQDLSARNAAKGSDDVLRIGDQNQGLELPPRSGDVDLRNALPRKTLCRRN